MPDAMNPDQIEVNGQTLSLKDYIKEHEELAEKNAALKASQKKAIRRYRREEELKPFQAELLKLQQYLEDNGRRMIILFEGRDAAGKGGTIKRFTEHLNPRSARVVALEKPTDAERTQWYFQRYIKHLPSAGEMVFFDRSWYNRAGVERVMDFCEPNDYLEFMRQCPEFERMLVRSGIRLFKFWFSVTKEEQRLRFAARRKDGDLAGFWEFPGGKIEAAETAEQCLVREMFEEFGVVCTVKEHFGESIYHYPDKTIRLLGYYIDHQSGLFECRDHDRICWLPVSRLHKVQWAPADLDFVRRLQLLGE